MGCDPFSGALIESWLCGLFHFFLSFFFLKKADFKIYIQYIYRENIWSFVMQDTQFNSVITIMYLPDIIETGAVLLFLLNKFEKMDSLLDNK